MTNGVVGQERRIIRNLSSQRKTALETFLRWGTAPIKPLGLLIRRMEGLVYREFVRLSNIPNSPYGLMLYRIERYSGRSLRLPCGTEIHPGTTVCQVHFNNLAVRKLKNTFHISLIAALREELRNGVEFMETDIPDAQALFAVTLLTPVAVRLGFTVRDLPLNFHARMTRAHMAALMLLFHHDGLGRASRLSKLPYPREVWMSRELFRSRYGRQSELPERRRAIA